MTLIASLGGRRMKKKETEDYTEQLRRNAAVAADIIHRYLKGEEEGSDKIKIASLAITQDCKHRATNGAVGALQFAICRSVAESQDELKNMIQYTMPDIFPVPRLK